MASDLDRATRTTKADEYQSTFDGVMPLFIPLQIECFQEYTAICMSCLSALMRPTS